MLARSRHCPGRPTSSCPYAPQPRRWTWPGRWQSLLTQGSVACSSTRTRSRPGPPGESGSPAGSTRLYLSGSRAAQMRDLFRGTALDARAIDGGVGAASAVKMAYAAWTKGTAALILTVRALARAEGVEDILLAEWQESQPGLADRSRSAEIFRRSPRGGAAPADERTVVSIIDALRPAF